MRRLLIVVGLWLAVGGASAPTRADDPQPEKLPHPTARDTLLGEGTAEATASAADDFEPRPLAALNLDVRPSAGEMPDDIAARRFAKLTPPSEVGPRFSETVYFWQASNLAHRPLRFEQAYVERYGYNYGLLQPVVSGAEFYADVALLPVKVMAKGPYRCIYTLGTGRPGSYGVPCPRH